MTDEVICHGAGVRRAQLRRLAAWMRPAISIAAAILLPACSRNLFLDIANETGGPLRVCGREECVDIPVASTRSMKWLDGKFQITKLDCTVDLVAEVPQPFSEFIDRKSGHVMLAVTADLRVIATRTRPPSTSENAGTQPPEYSIPGVRRGP